MISNFNSLEINYYDKDGLTFRVQQNIKYWNVNKFIRPTFYKVGRICK